MADAAAQAVSNVELLLSTGASEFGGAIDHQLEAFKSHEHGLLATWETRTSSSAYRAPGIEPHLRISLVAIVRSLSASERFISHVGASYAGERITSRH